MKHSPCARVDPELMFPEPQNTHAVKTAKSICEDCAFLAECRELALAPATRSPYGVWGGLSEAERRDAIRREKRGRARRALYPAKAA
ncbi:WhiB family transcriptional regulator [Streptomyces sp. BV286]|uniref:WhiB family transcriptional regulator n=1 Tax=Streptomyces sp. BV286 TaxID=2849672 RepID=UPI00267134E5|nr:WhiB family transcriptional regulator [Streptomyces sp. BV286]